MVHLFNHMLKPYPGLSCTCLHMKANRVNNLTVLVPHHLRTKRRAWLLPERDVLITEQHQRDNQSSPNHLQHQLSVLQRRHILPLPNVSTPNASPPHFHIHGGSFHSLQLSRIPLHMCSRLINATEHATHMCSSSWSHPLLTTQPKRNHRKAAVPRQRAWSIPSESCLTR